MECGLVGSKYLEDTQSHDMLGLLRDIDISLLEFEYKL